MTSISSEMASDRPTPFSQVDNGASIDRWVPSTCGLCSIGCGLEIAVAGPRIIGVGGGLGIPSTMAGSDRRV